VSIGYKGVAVEGSEPWFDDSRGVMKNIHGLVDAANSELGGLYVSGWLKRGPSGIIGTNIGDAKDTVATILKDLQEESSTVQTSDTTTTTTTTLDELLKKRNVQVVDWAAFQKIEAAETSKERKRHAEQPREKITTRDELLAIAFSS
jgi:NADPH-dependent glutamate synthase beta subunit-like oxidoreductase